jgi:hypothetical protein
VVLPLAAFVLLVAGVAWLAQYLPGRSGQTPPTKDPRKVTFQLVRSPYEGERPGQNYSPEYEWGSTGHHDWIFANGDDGAAEIGLRQLGCGCSHLEFCLLTPGERELIRDKATVESARAALRAIPKSRMQEVAKDDRLGVAVPAGEWGVLRLVWDSRKQEEDKIRLTVDLWVQTEGQKKREFPRLDMVVNIVPAARCFPDKLDMGTLYPGTSVTRELLCWSSTRDQLDLVVSDTSDPCLEIKIRPLDQAGRDGLLAKLLEAKIPTRVRSACAVTVTLHESKGGKELDMGFFQRQLPLEVRNTGKRVEMASATIYGGVRSDVKVHSTEGMGKINLGDFSYRDGKVTKVLLLADPKIDVKYDKHEPASLKVKAPVKKSASANEAVWEMEVAVPPRTYRGALPPDSAVYLLTDRGKGATRRVRLPVLGTAVRD